MNIIIHVIITPVSTLITYKCFSSFYTYAYIILHVHLLIAVVLPFFYGIRNNHLSNSPTIVHSRQMSIGMVLKATEQAFNYTPIDTNRLNIVARVSGKKSLDISPSAILSNVIM